MKYQTCLIFPISPTLQVKLGTPKRNCKQAKLILESAESVSIGTPPSMSMSSVFVLHLVLGLHVLFILNIPPFYKHSMYGVMLMAREE